MFFSYRMTGIDGNKSENADMEIISAPAEVVVGAQVETSM